jgi:hypothetical protein
MFASNGEGILFVGVMAVLWRCRSIMLLMTTCIRGVVVNAAVTASLGRSMIVTVVNNNLTRIIKA